jgi:hypothetical protein
MNERKLESLEDLIQASLDPRALRERFGLPHPLSKFAANGTVNESPYADAILEFQASLGRPNGHYPDLCDVDGIDAACRVVGREDEERLPRRPGN